MTDRETADDIYNRSLEARGMSEVLNVEKLKINIKEVLSFVRLEGQREGVEKARNLLQYADHSAFCAQRGGVEIDCECGYFKARYAYQSLLAELNEGRGK